MKQLKEHLILPALVFFWLLLIASNPAFRNLDVYNGILKEGAMVAICGIGMTFAVISGGLDLSIASQIALSSVVFTKIVNTISPSNPLASIILSCVIILLLGAAMGCVNGLMIAKLKLPPFIATLATMNVYRGLAQLVSNSPITLESCGTDYQSFPALATTDICGIPLFALIMVVLTALGAFLLRCSVLGHRTLAIGNSREAARLSGISVAGTELKIYVLVGVFTAISALMMTANQGSSNYGVPVGTEFTVISAVVLGGTALAGGAGSVLNTAVAAVFLATISTALTTYGVGTNVYGIFRGAILIFAFSLYTMRMFAAQKPANAVKLKIASIVFVLLLIAGAVWLGVMRQDSKSAGSGKQLTFGWTVYDMSNPFFVPMDEGVRKAAEEHGITLLPTHDEKGDATEMMTGVQALIAQGIDALVISPFSPESMGQVSALAKKANIPVVVCDIGTGGASINAFLRSDMYGGGKKCGEYFIRMMKENAYPSITSKKLAIIKVETSATYALQRGEGFKDAVLKEGYTILAEQHGDSNKDKAYGIMQDYLTRFGSELAAVFCENDEMALGAVAAIDEKGMTGKILVYGFDGNDDAIAAIKQGKMAGTVAQDSYGIGHMGLDIAYSLATGGTVTASEVDKDGNKVFLVPVTMIGRDGAPVETAEKAAAPAKSLTFGWSVYNMANPFFIPMDEGVRKGAEEHGIKLLPTHDEKGDATEMMTGVQALIAQGIDALVISPFSPESMGQVSRLAKKANIPVVVCDIGTGGASIDAFLRSDMYGGGKKCGEYFIRMMKENAYPAITSKKLAIIKVETSATYALQRGEGFKAAVLKEGYTILAEQHGDSNKDKAYGIMQDYLTRFGNELAAVFCENDEMALGAVAAIDEKGLTGKILVYGFDGNDDAIAAIKQGKMGGTVAQDSYGIGHMGLDIASKLVTGTAITPSEVDKDGNKVFLVPVTMIGRDGKKVE